VTAPAAGVAVSQAIEVEQTASVIAMLLGQA
jgi:hypothetical protein